MEYQEYRNMTKEEYEKKYLDLSQNLIFIWMNTLSHIVYNGYYFCFCREELPIKCSICKVSENYVDFEDEIKKYIFDFEYLKKHHDKLFPYLMKMFHLNIETICCFLHQEYQTKGRDWYTGDIWCCSVYDSVCLIEKIEINKIQT